MDSDLNHIHPFLALQIRNLLKLAAKAKLNVAVFEGYRSIARQNELKSRGESVTRAKGGLSWHNYGLACDVVFKDDKGAWSWDPKHDWNKLGKMGKSLGLIWGGNVKRGGDFNTMDDCPHFEWHPGFLVHEVSKAFQIWNRARTLAAVWNTLRVPPVRSWTNPEILDTLKG